MRSFTKHLYNGSYYTVPELAEMAKTSTKNMHKRLKIMSIEEAVHYVAPPKNLNRAVLYPYKNEFLTVKAFSKQTGIDDKTIYSKLKEGKTLEEIEYERLHKIKTNNRIPIKYEWNGKELTIPEIAEIEGIDASNLYRRIKSGYSLEAAIKVIKNNQTKYFYHNGKYYSRAELIKEYPNLSESKLYSLLLVDEEYTEEDINNILIMCNKDDILMMGNISLYKYCLENKYNYTVIYYLVKKKNLTPEQAINYYLEFGQGDPKVGKYFVGNILLCHFSIMEQLDQFYINYYLNMGLTDKEAIIMCVFNSNETTLDRTKREKLSSLYFIWRELSDEDRIKIEEDYNLDILEKEYLSKKHILVTKILRDYDMFKLANYMDVLDDVEINNILSKHGITLERAAIIIEELYGNFEETTNGSAMYKWKKEH